ncbi:hypothetical protein DQ04_16481000 [Trypanosoma grayi]|uniref:hypothetical protein n=1 Tax=Trypanosoma grayi TaxID=71804 RepID=UPI0004F471AF|nr:hypothetical protein DQ04_16481000 [Trypanosoma grayi]KEG06017.1 hypothetical protein DQ04_16481000 [Trypanosoma grayi]
MRSTDDQPLYHIAAPPVPPPPPPMPTTISYTLSQEMPHLKSMELEGKMPSHVPQVRGLDYVALRKEGKLS